MRKKAVIDGQSTEYELVYKKVRNINLRVRPDGSIYVSAPGCVPEVDIQAFLEEKADFIRRAREKYKDAAHQVPQPLLSEEEVKMRMKAYCDALYPHFAAKGIKYPEIRFRKMRSQWGNCRPREGVLTLNTNLRYVPEKCMECVVAHEFVHFLVPGHKEAFYRELSAVIPDYKERNELLKKAALSLAVL